MRLSLLALLLCVSAAAAGAGGGPQLECPDGRTPVLTGHPFRPVDCPPGGKEPARADVAVSTATAPLGSKGGDLRTLDGKWRGLCYFGGARYECELEVADGGKRGAWLAMDYHTHLGHALEAVLVKPGWFSRGVPRIEVTMPHLPGARLTGRVWLSPGAAGWKYDGRPEAHRVDYKVSGDHLSAVYTDFDPEHGPVSVSVDLDRVR